MLRESDITPEIRRALACAFWHAWLHPDRPLPPDPAMVGVLIRRDDKERLQEELLKRLIVKLGSVMTDAAAWVQDARVSRAFRQRRWNTEIDRAVRELAAEDGYADD